MTTLNISLPETMRAYVDQKVSDGGYSTASEYVRELIRADQKRAAQQRLERLLLEGLDSGPMKEMTPDWWEQKKARLIGIIAKESGS